MPLDFFSADHALYDRPQGIPLLNRDSPQAQGLVGWWPLSRAADARDYSGFNRHGSFQNGAVLAPVPEIGYGLRTTASTADNDHISVPDFTLTLGDFTCIVWFIDYSVATSFERLVDKSFDLGFWLGRNGTTSNSWGGGVREGTTPFGRFVTLEDGKLHQIVSRRQGTTHTIIGDGGQVSTSGTVTAQLLSTASLLFGIQASGLGADLTDGFVADIKMYDWAVPDPIIEHSFAPDTRWDLYWQPRIMVPGFVAAAGVAGRRLMNTPLNFGFMR